MKLSFPHVALIAGCLSFAGMSAILADDSSDSSTPPPPQEGHHHGGPLTPDQWQELKKDRETVFTNDPDLKTQAKALHEQEKALQDKIDEEVIKIDANAAPLIAKLQEAHHHHFGPPPGDEGGGQ